MDGQLGHGVARQTAMQNLSLLQVLVTAALSAIPPGNLLHRHLLAWDTSSVVIESVTAFPRAFSPPTWIHQEAFNISIWQHSSTVTSHGSYPDGWLHKPTGMDGQLGHGVARQTAMQNLSLLQVLVTAALSAIPPGNLLHRHLLAWDTSSVVIESVTAFPRAFSPPTWIHQEAFNISIWQHSSTVTSHGSYPDGWLHKPTGMDGQLGHGVARQTAMQNLSLLQVGYLPNAVCSRSRNPNFIAMSCPNDLFWRKWLCFYCLQYSYIFYVSRLLLLMSGDVEANPGPLTDSEQITSILAAVQRIEAAQTNLLATVSSLESGQKATEISVQQLFSRMSAVETRLADRNSASLTPHDENLPVDLANIQKQCDDNENRLRRSNLLFFGCPDNSTETWGQSEQKIIEFCSSKLGIQLDPANLERSHRLGKFEPQKARPIIVKFARFKDKESILACGFKLKGTHYAVREDFSASVRVARAKLFEYGRSMNVPFKVRFNKLHADNKRFIFNSESQTVVEFS
ncbi:uncharacterized protein LOC121046141 [Ixodes scapularis]|uniref:uncharacterized protein LOC121046141 n=1 Tax=Ixodes scapularis TaxID=6945 RepID=UPI001C38F82A|nr:uncharacterized protein LOC121046141 [Ixodes scapularis]